MAVGTKTNIILYDGRDADSKSAAGQLQSYLDRQGARFYAQDYADAAAFSADLPQHLILIYTPRAQGDPQVETLIDTMLAQSLERRVGGIVIVTSAPSSSQPQMVSVPRKWASIPTYNIGSIESEGELEKRVWSEFQHVKLPYSQAQDALASTPAFRSTSKRRSTSPFLISALSAIVLLLIVATTWFVAFKVFPSSTHLAATPTVRPANATSLAGTKTAIAQPTPNAEQKAREQDLAAIVKKNPAVSGFQATSGWASDDSAKGCVLSNANYTVSVKQAGQYQPCLASGLSYKNFAMQVTMNIKGDAGGVIFRFSNAAYYRLSVNQIYTASSDTPTFSLYLCTNGACAGNNINSGQQLATFNPNIGKSPIKLAIVSRDTNIDIYGNGTFLKRIVETNAIGAGQIGVYAADINNETAATFSDLKVWSLESK